MNDARGMMPSLLPSPLGGVLICSHKQNSARLENKLTYVSESNKTGRQLDMMRGGYP